MNAIEFCFVKFQIIVLLVDIIKIEMFSTYIVVCTNTSDATFEVLINPNVFPNEDFQNIRGTITSCGDGSLVLSGELLSMTMVSVKTNKNRVIPRYKDDDLFGKD